MNKAIIVNDTNYTIPASQEELDKIVDHLTKKMKLHSEANLIIINSAEMQKLYFKYKNLDKTTDVLSFPADWKALSKVLKYIMLGDIYINWEYIIKQSKEFGHSEKREFCYLFAHGVLHLLGHNHKEKDEETIMNNLTEEAMEAIGVKRYERSI